MYWSKHPLLKTCQLQLTSAAIIAIFSIITLLALPLHAQTYRVLHNFTEGTDGYYPEGGLTLNGTGNLFGGASDSVFRVKQTGTSWIFSPIFDFNDPNGNNLAGRVTFGPSGALYGATYFGGIPNCIDGSGCGVIFSMRPTGSICRSVSCRWSQTVIYQFDPQNRLANGFGPNGGLVFDSSGNIYGTTYNGGLGNAGVVFMLTRSQGGWTLSPLYNFHESTDGGNPNGNLVIDRSGNIIGTTQIGGNNNCPGPGCGVVFELTHTSSGWVESTLHSFTGADGARPYGGLISDAAGNLYGTTLTGGANGGGTVYELTPSNGGYSFQVLYSSPGTSGQFGPMGILGLDSTGNLYGVTNDEGAFGLGNVFKLTHSGSQWIYSDLHDFTGGSDGAAPYDGPVVDPSGNLYGTTLEGGTGSDSCPGGCGVIWEIAP